MVGRVLKVPDAVIDMIEEEACEVSEKCYSKWYCVFFLDIRTDFKWLKNQCQSDWSAKAQQEQTVQWTDQNSKQLQ